MPLLLICHQATNCSSLIVSILCMSLIEKAFIRRIKKPVLNPTLKQNHALAREEQ